MEIAPPAVVTTEPVSNTFVIYATKAGGVAFEGEGENSPFAAALLKHLPTPGLEIRKLTDLVRDDVMTATQKRQQPFSYGALAGDGYYFVPAK